MFPKAQQDFEPYLVADERILWSGTPHQGILFQPLDIFLIPFSIIWGGFAISWEASVITTGAPLLFTLWGIPFVLVGLYVTVGRFLHDAAIRRRQLYAVTDKRVLMLSRNRSFHVNAIDIRALPALQLSERRDGSGTIDFESHGGFGSWLPMNRNIAFGIWTPSLGRPPRFTRIPKVREVYALITRQAATADRA